MSKNKKNIVHQFYGQRPQIRRTKYKKKLLFAPLKQCLSAHVMHFSKFMSNTLLIFVTYFFLSLNVSESKKKILCTSSIDNNLKLGEQNFKKTMIWTLETMLKCTCYAFLKNYVHYITNICNTFSL